MGPATPSPTRAGDGEASPFSIESNVAFQERRVTGLKHGHTFAVFGRRGDIVACKGSTDGIYHRDTRYLSRLELRLNGAPLLLLSSNVQEDNTALTVDLANPGTASPDLRGELIHLNRLKFIWDSACYERILVRNFDLRPHIV